jgi:glycogen operon protein
MERWPGAPFPLGATWDGRGTNFAIFSENAERVELCLFDGDEGPEERIELIERTAFNWHCYLPGVGPGQRYAYRIHGPYDPESGARFNPTKLLLDPYAKAIEGAVDFGAANVFPYVPPDPDDREAAGDADLYADDEDDAEAIPKCIVIDPSFDWEGVRAPGRPWNETVIYETHVKGFTQLNEHIREDLRGTYAGLASEPAIEYLISLGVTAVELLPIHHISDEDHLVRNGLSNYWGYSSIGYLAPHALYAATGMRGDQVKEFKGMVKALHRAGIEVILDVVYNHTAEGSHLGPMLSFRGVDNESYYRLQPDDPRLYTDFTGTGNSLNPAHPSVLRLIMDSLRYFVSECHVDGFRFDLAAALAREFFEVDRLSAFFDIIHQDPVISQVKLIAEPWDLGEGGYQVGNFPVLWTEWNGLYRDVMRDFWRGNVRVGDFAFRFTGSADLYGNDGRKPSASINFITAHDGFTLNDLVSYNDKHNEANLEGNRDGTDDNRSWNCGSEGPTDDPEINELRDRQMRNFLATLFLSQGVPMLVAGDERARTQDGNNNAYCQDNEISWLDWSLDEQRSDMVEFTRRLIAFRAEHPVFRRSSFLAGDQGVSKLPDVWWFRPDGRKMTRRDWERVGAPRLGIFLNGAELAMLTAEGAPVSDDSFLILFNAYHEDVDFTLPTRRFGLRWRAALSTDGPDAPDEIYAARETLEVTARSLLVLRREP